MSIGREESLFLTVSEDHRQRAYPEYVQRMSAPFSRAGGMVAAYEGVLLGGADKRFGLDELNLWLRRYRYAAYDMDVLLPAAHLCLERGRSCAAICCNTAAARAAGSIFTTLQRGFPARKRSRIAVC